MDILEITSATDTIDFKENRGNDYMVAEKSVLTDIREASVSSRIGEV